MPSFGLFIRFYPLYLGCFCHYFLFKVNLLDISNYDAVLSFFIILTSKGEAKIKIMPAATAIYPTLW